MKRGRIGIRRAGIGARTRPDTAQRPARPFKRAAYGVGLCTPARNGR